MITSPTPTAATTEKKKTFAAKNLTAELVSRVAAGTKATGYAGNRLTLLKGGSGTAGGFGVKAAVGGGKPVGLSGSAPSAPLQKVKGENGADVKMGGGDETGPIFTVFTFSPRSCAPWAWAAVC